MVASFDDTTWPLGNSPLSGLSGNTLFGGLAGASFARTYGVDDYRIRVVPPRFIDHMSKLNAVVRSPAFEHASKLGAVMRSPAIELASKPNAVHRPLAEHVSKLTTVMGRHLSEYISSGSKGERLSSLLAAQLDVLVADESSAIAPSDSELAYVIDRDLQIPNHMFVGMVEYCLDHGINMQEMIVRAVAHLIGIDPQPPKSPKGRHLKLVP